LVAAFLLIPGSILAFALGVTTQYGGWIAAASGVALIAAIVLGIRARLVYATKITKEKEMWVGGCCKAFVQEFPE
jgi:hypothetical protein